MKVTTELLKEWAKSGKIKQSDVTGQKMDDRPRVSKYRSQKTSSDGIVFDSKKEACRYNELKFLQSIGEISELQLQVCFQLSVCKYYADFVYKDKSGLFVVEDVKSPATKKKVSYRIKYKMMKHELGITIKEF